MPSKHADNVSDEQSPLLRSTQNEDQESANNSKTPTNLSHVRRNVYIIAFILSVLITLGAYLQFAPLNKVLEDAICRDYYPELVGAEMGDEDSRCKSSPVQNELAMLRGWTMTFDCVPSILTAIPYGYLADKYGRKPIFCLSLLGMFLSLGSYVLICWCSDFLPLRLTWLTSGWVFIGGGTFVFDAMLYTMLSDVSTEESRSTIFFYLASCTLIGELGASALASLLMTKSPWIPILIGNGLIFLGLAVSLLLPETLHVRADSKVPADMASNGSVTEEDGASNHWYSKAYADASRLATAAIHFIWGNKHIALLLSTMILMMLGRYVGEIMLQYVTKRYHWTWAQAGFLLSLKAVLSLVLLVALLPGASYLLITALSLEARSKDLWLARGSSILTAIGVFTIAVSTRSTGMVIGVAVWSIGAGYNPIVRSLLTSIVEPHHVGTLYNTIAVFEAIGSLVAGPLLSYSFRRGMDLGGGWIGLPFLGATVLASTSTIIVWSVRLPREAPALESEDEINNVEVRT